MFGDRERERREKGERGYVTVFEIEGRGIEGEERRREREGEEEGDGGWKKERKGVEEGRGGESDGVEKGGRGGEGEG